LEKARRKLLRREKRYEISQLMKRKLSEDYETLEEVFDKSTLLTIYRLFRSDIIRKIGGVISAGKESRIYWAEDPSGHELALKIYLTTSADFKRGMLPYIAEDPRFKHVRRTTRSLVYAWALKEFKNLKRAYEGGVDVPRPITVKKNVLVMEFIGKNRIPAPLMKDTMLKNPKEVYSQLLECIKKLYKTCRLVHGDLSQYNVMIWNEKPIIFDISQAVPLEHPMAEELLLRDLRNLNAYFKKLGVETRPVEELYEWVRGD
jgi:RIO kinase 1